MVKVNKVEMGWNNRSGCGYLYHFGIITTPLGNEIKFQERDMQVTKKELDFLSKPFGGLKGKGFEKTLTIEP